MKGNSRAMLLAAAAAAMMTFVTGVMAQSPTENRGGALERAGTLQRFGLADAALRLTELQKAEIAKAADAYVAEMKALNEKYPFTPGTPPSQESIAARNKARETLMSASTRVLSAEQKRTLEASQAARSSAGAAPAGVRPTAQ